MAVDEMHGESSDCRVLRIGIMGGTFDPVHIGHLMIAEEARCHLHLDQVIFVPARISPLKQGDGTWFADEQRYRMVCAAVQSNAAFAVSRVDLDRPAPSYTVDTLHLLRASLGSQHLYHFVLGADSLTTLSKWRRPAEIVRLARLAVVSRPGFALDLSGLERTVPGVTAATDLLDGLMIDISSTDIRRRLQSGLSIRYLVPDAVLALIQSGECHPQVG